MLKPKLNKIRIALLIGCLFGLALAQITTTLFHTEIAFIKCTGPEDPLEAWSESSYIVWKYNSTHTAMRNMSTLICEGISTNASQIINWAIGNSSEGSVIYIKSPFYASGSVIITKSRITIKADLRAASQLVTIGSLEFNSSTSAIIGVKLEGITFENIEFYAETNSITHIYFDYCVVESAGTPISEGVVFDGDDSAEINNIHFTKCYFYDGGQSARSGFFSIIFANSGNGQLYLDHCTYTCYNAGVASCIAFETGSYWGPPIFIDDLNCYVVSPTQFNFITIEPEDTGDYPQTGGHVSVVNSWFELHQNTTFITFEDSAKSQVGYMSFIANQISVNADAVAIVNRTVTSQGYIAIAWIANTNMGGDYTVGIVPKWTANIMRVSQNIDLNPLGVLTNPFIGTVVGYGGTSANPTANTDYKVDVTDIIMTCSGGTDVNMTVYDVDASIIATNLTSLTLQYLPIGYVINFGDFAVAPTTMIVSGN